MPAVWKIIALCGGDKQDKIKNEMPKYKSVDLHGPVVFHYYLTCCLILHKGYWNLFKMTSEVSELQIKIGLKFKVTQKLKSSWINIKKKEKEKYRKANSDKIEKKKIQ